MPSGKVHTLGDHRRQPRRALHAARQRLVRVRLRRRPRARDVQAAERPHDHDSYEPQTGRSSGETTPEAQTAYTYADADRSGSTRSRGRRPAAATEGLDFAYDSDSVTGVETTGSAPGALHVRLRRRAAADVGQARQRRRHGDHRARARRRRAAHARSGRSRSCAAVPAGAVTDIKDGRAAGEARPRHARAARTGAHVLGRRRREVRLRAHATTRPAASTPQGRDASDGAAETLRVRLRRRRPAARRQATAAAPCSSTTTTTPTATAPAARSARGRPRSRRSTTRTGSRSVGATTLRVRRRRLPHRAAARTPSPTARAASCSRRRSAAARSRYAYDGLGRRVARTVDGATTRVLLRRPRQPVPGHGVARARPAC